MEKENNFDNFDEINNTTNGNDTEPLSIEEVLEMYNSNKESDTEEEEKEAPKKK